MRLEELEELKTRDAELAREIKQLKEWANGLSMDRFAQDPNYRRLRADRIALRKRAFDIHVACLSDYDNTSACPKCRFAPRTTKYETVWMKQPLEPKAEFTLHDPSRAKLWKSEFDVSGEVMVRQCPQCSARTFEKPLDLDLYLERMSR